MAKPVKIAVLASGRGSNFEAIVRAVRSGSLDAEISALISDQQDAGSLVIARHHGIPAVVVEPLSGGNASERREKHDLAMIEALKPFSPRFLVMAGYMRVVTSRLLEEFVSERGYSRVVNVHPSLLPAFPGLNSYARAFHHGAKVAGATIHLVEEGVDAGPICAQEAFRIDDCRSEAEVETRGLAVEHRLYPQTLRWVLTEKFEIEKGHEGRVRVRPN